MFPSRMYKQLWWRTRSVICAPRCERVKQISASVVLAVDTRLLWRAGGLSEAGGIKRYVDNTRGPQPVGLDGILRGVSVFMNKQVITVGHSPDPDDAFMFHALAHDKIDTGPFTFTHELQDI